MKVIAAFLALALVVFPAAAEQPANQTYADLKPAQYGIDLSFNISGAQLDAPPCTSSAPGSACLPQLTAGLGNTVRIAYSVNTTSPVNSTSTITLKACFGPQSTANRAWRKPSPVISSDKQCSVKIASGLPPTGEYTYTIGFDVAPAVYNIIALEVCSNGAYCNMGLSSGYYQTLVSDDKPTWLMALVGVFSTIGPITLAGFFIGERYVKKRQ